MTRKHPLPSIPAAGYTRERRERRERTLEEKYTLVQHSAYGYKRNPQFRKAVEVRRLNNATEVKRVERANGVVIDGYREAEDLAERINYPSDMNPRSIIPEARGSFSTLEIDSLRIYIPKRAIAE
jgi:hypothetical protein